MRSTRPSTPGTRLRDLVHVRLRAMLTALPPRALRPLAWLAARLWPWLGRVEEANARTSCALALGLALDRVRGAPVWRQAAFHTWLDRLTAWHGRNAAARAAATSLRARATDTHSPRTLYLNATVGWPCLLERARPGTALDIVNMEGAPCDADASASLEWLGRVLLVDVLPVRRALAQGRAVRLLLLLGDEPDAPYAWASPDLATPDLLGSGKPVEATEVLQRALDVVALLARARPDLVGWQAPRWPLRATRELDGHPSWSRWAPWLGRPRRAREVPRARPGATQARRPRAGPGRATGARGRSAPPRGRRG